MEKTLDEILAEASGGEQTPTTTTAPAQEPAQEPAPATDDGGDKDGDKTPAPATSTPPAQEPTTDPAPEGTPAPSSGEGGENKTKPNPMKEVRDKYNQEQKAREKIESAMQRFTDGEYDFKLKDFKDEKGKIDYDKLIEAMDKVDTANKAKSNNITPELQEAIDRIEREKQEIAKEKIKVAMDRALSDLQVNNGLNKEAINNFFKDSMALKKNPYQWLNQGGSLQELYDLVYRDKIMEAKINEAVAKAKLEWEKTKGVAPTTNPAAPAVDSSSVDGVSLSDLLAEAFTKGSN